MSLDETPREFGPLLGILGKSEPNIVRRVTIQRTISDRDRKSRYTADQYQHHPKGGLWTFQICMNPSKTMIWAVLVVWMFLVLFWRLFWQDSQVAEGPLAAARRLVDASYHGHYTLERQRLLGEMRSLVDFERSGVCDRKP